MTAPRDERSWPDGTESAEALARAAAGAEVEVEVPAAARARVWARVAERRAGRRLRARALVAGFAIAAVTAVLVAVSLRPPSGATLGPVVAAADRVYRLRNEARIVTSPGTRANLIADDARGATFELMAGSLLADVEHRPAGAPFVVRTPWATVRVVGTVFWVSVDAAAARTTVLVARGAVEVTPAGGAAPIRVRAGERWPASSVESPAIEDLRALDPGGDGLRFATPAPSPPPPPQTTQQPPSPEPARPPLPARAGALPSRAPPSRGPVTADCRELATTEAITCLRRLASSTDALRAETALHEIGWREFRERHDPRAALAAWERQRRRFPSGALRTEADVSIIEALMKLDDRPRARREIEAFLGAHGDRSLDAPLVLYFSGSLAHAEGDCARAVRDLDRALRAPGAAWAEDARRARAACLASSPR